MLLSGVSVHENGFLFFGYEYANHKGTDHEAFLLWPPIWHQNEKLCTSSSYKMLHSDNADSNWNYRDADTVSYEEQPDVPPDPGYIHKILSASLFYMSLFLLSIGFPYPETTTSSKSSGTARHRVRIRLPLPLPQ